MADQFTVTVEDAALLSAFARLGPAIENHTRPAARITADNIARESQSRVARATGETAAGIIVQEDHARVGYVVLATNKRMPALPMWLEFGTKHMTARPYFFSSARLEESAHNRRMRDAVQAAIDEVTP